jgi:hypothetical protein
MRVIFNREGAKDAKKKELPARYIPGTWVGQGWA